MNKKTAQQLNELTQVAAFRIVNALAVFDTYPPEIRHQAEQIIMQRVQLMRSGDRSIIEGDSLITVIDDTGSAPETPTP